MARCRGFLPKPSLIVRHQIQFSPTKLECAPSFQANHASNRAHHLSHHVGNDCAWSGHHHLTLIWLRISSNHQFPDILLTSSFSPSSHEKHRHHAAILPHSVPIPSTINVRHNFELLLTVYLKAQLATTTLATKFDTSESDTPSSLTTDRSRHANIIDRTSYSLCITTVSRLVA